MAVNQMRHKEIIELVKVTTEQDNIGNEIETEKRRKVYANQFAVSSAEFYDAGVSDLKPEKSFRIHTFEYEDEEALYFKDIKYKIIRTSEVGDKVTLVCERVIGHG